ncbi:MAG TPA: hypothetical protein VJ951_07230, partial [Bacteroidales bacterium]|nr:hypothetical protein [Bacteroidales bacterium]
MVRSFLNFNVGRVAFFTLFFFLFIFSSSGVSAQDAFIQVKSESTICEGESTTLEVIIGSSVGPYTVVYSDGTSDYTVTDYSSNGDPESSGYGGDPITVSPTVSINYELVSVHDTYNNSLSVSSST